LGPRCGTPMLHSVRTLAASPRAARPCRPRRSDGCTGGRRYDAPSVVADCCPRVDGSWEQGLRCRRALELVVLRGGPHAVAAHSRGMASYSSASASPDMPRGRRRSLARGPRESGPSGRVRQGLGGRGRTVGCRADAEHGDPASGPASSDTGSPSATSRTRLRTACHEPWIEVKAPDAWHGVRRASGVVLITPGTPLRTLVVERGLPDLVHAWSSLDISASVGDLLSGSITALGVATVGSLAPT